VQVRILLYHKIQKEGVLKTEALARMEAASFCGGVRYKRYSGQPD